MRKSIFVLALISFNTFAGDCWTDVYNSQRTTPIVDQRIKTLIAEMNTARSQQNYKLVDKIRSRGIEIDAALFAVADAVCNKLLSK